MVMTIEIPDRILQEAKARGVSVEVLLSDAFADRLPEAPPPGFVRFGHSAITADEAAAGIEAIAQRNTLDGLHIKELIHEGRRF
jgi:DNA-binding transcriptional MocR family regulator